MVGEPLVYQIYKYIYMGISMETIKTPEKTNLGEIPSFVPSPASLQIEFNPCFFHMCHGQKSRFLGDGRPPTFNNGILIMGPYKPLLLG